MIPAAPGAAARDSQSCYVFYMADSISGAITTYDGSTHKQLSRIKSSHLYKWGMAANTSTIFAATDTDAIDEYAPCGTTILKTLQGAGKGGPSGGAAMGLTALDDGTLYAGEFPTNKIDIFSPQGTDTVVKDANLSIVTYLAADATDHIFVDGFNAKNSQITEVDQCDLTFTSCSIMSAVVRPGWPGGLALDSHQNLWVNDETGYMYEYTFISGYASQAVGSPLHYWNAKLQNVYTGVAFDRSEGKLWGAEIYSCGTQNSECSVAQSLRVPLGKLGPKTSPAWQDAQALGIAVYPPGKI